MLRGM